MLLRGGTRIHQLCSIVQGYNQHYAVREVVGAVDFLVTEQLSLCLSRARVTPRTKRARAHAARAQCTGVY